MTAPLCLLRPRRAAGPDDASRIMLVPILYAKIHRATVTAASLHYHGSITIDRRLMDLAGLLPHQQVQVYNITNGHRFETYVIEGGRGSGCIQINGAAAHLAGEGDLIIVAAYVSMAPADAAIWQPRIVFVDDANRPIDPLPRVLEDEAEAEC